MAQQQLQALCELEQAAYDLSSRCLHQAARWATEQLNGLDAELLQQATAAAVALAEQQQAPQGQPGEAQQHHDGLLAPPLRVDAIDRAPQYMLARQHFEFKV